MVAKRIQEDRNGAAASDRQLSIATSAASLGDIFHKAAASAASHLNSLPLRQMQQATPAYTADIQAEFTAAGIAQGFSAGTNGLMNQPYLQEMRNRLGPLTTVVRLPDGRSFDTRQLQSNRATHRVSTNGLDASVIASSEGGKKRKSTSTRPPLYPFGAPPAKKKPAATKTTTTKTYSISGSAGGAHGYSGMPGVSFPAITMTTETVSSGLDFGRIPPVPPFATAATSSRIDASSGTGEVIDLSGVSPYEEASSSTTVSSITHESPITNLTSRATKRIMRSAGIIPTVNLATVDEEETMEPAAASSMPTQDQIRSRNLLRKVTDNQALTRLVVEGCVQAGVSLSQDVVNGLNNAHCA